MGFFDETQCIWTGASSGHPWDPPEDEFPYSIGLQPILIARTAEITIALIRLSAFRAGFDFTISAMRSLDVAHSSGEPTSLRQSAHFGLEFEDGRKGATFCRNADNVKSEITGENILIRPTSVGGGRRHQAWTYWARPLPPLGRMNFVFEWPLHAIEESRVTIAASLIIEAAQKSVFAFQQDETGRS